MDYLFRGLALNKKARVFGIDASESVARICKAHNTLPLTTVAFARFLLAGAIMGTLEKNSKGITMQITSDGVIKSLFMQATPNGLIRGYVGNPQGEVELSEDKLSMENVVGNNGILSVTKIFDEEHNFTSDVILTKSDITNDIVYYFFTSEQIPTIINLKVNLNEDGEVKDARGYLIQLITGYEESDVEFLEKLHLEEINDLNKNIISMFPDFEKLEQIEIKDVCDCSRERFKNSLSTLPINDLEELSKEEIEVVCQFCCKSYKFSSMELKEMIKEKQK